MATASGEADPGELARRLDYLFRTRVPRDARGKAFSYKRIVTAINAAEDTRVISEPYLCELRLGRKRNPSVSQVTAIERFFGVPEGYLLAEAPDVELDAEGKLELLAALSNKRVLGIALRAGRLRSDGLERLERALDIVAQDEADGSI
jgi:hypothetical protein